MTSGASKAKLDKLLNEVEVLANNLPTIDELLSKNEIRLSSENLTRCFVERSFNKTYYAKQFLAQDCLVRGFGVERLHLSSSDYCAIELDVKRDNVFLIALLNDSLMTHPYAAYIPKTETIKECYRDAVDSCIILQAFLASFDYWRPKLTIWEEPSESLCALRAWAHSILDEAYALAKKNFGPLPRWSNEIRLYEAIHQLFDDAVFQYRAPWLERQSLDIYIPSIGVAVEYQGEQHYGETTYFDELGQGGYNERLLWDARKIVTCKMHGIRLVEWPHTRKVTFDGVLALFKESAGIDINAASLREKLLDPGVPLLFKDVPTRPTQDVTKGNEPCLQCEIREFAQDGAYIASYSTIEEASASSGSSEDDVVIELCRKGPGMLRFMLCQQDEAVNVAPMNTQVKTGLGFGSSGSIMVFYESGELSFIALPCAGDEIHASNQLIRNAEFIAPGDSLMVATKDGYIYLLDYDELQSSILEDGVATKTGAILHYGSIASASVMKGECENLYAVVFQNNGKAKAIERSNLRKGWDRPIPIGADDGVFGAVVTSENDLIQITTTENRTLVTPTGCYHVLKPAAGFRWSVLLKDGEELKTLGAIRDSGSSPWIFVSNKGVVKKYRSYDYETRGRLTSGLKTRWAKSAGSTLYVQRAPLDSDILFLGKASKKVNCKSIPFGSPTSTKGYDIEQEGVYPIIISPKLNDDLE